MQEQNRISVTDKDGWQKEFLPAKNIFFIGSAATNDIPLEQRRGSGVDSCHLQVIVMPGQGYRLINLGEHTVWIGGNGGQELASRLTIDIAGGQTLQVGEFSLVFAAPTSGFAPINVGSANSGGMPATSAENSFNPDSQNTSDFIGVSLFLPQTVLSPDEPIDGMIKIRNKGDKPKVQFMLEVEGLEPNCYNLSPGPILFPNAEKALPLRLYHPKNAHPLAGKHMLKIRVTAPEAYPREQTTVVTTLTILPYYRHKLQLVPSD